MTNRPPPTLSKWIFVLTDVLLLIGFVWILQPVLPPKSTGDYVTIIVAATFWMIGAWICLKPWLEEFRARNKHLENETLASAVEQIQRMEEVASRIQSATGTWQSAQDAATRTATAAREIEERIKTQMKEFMDFTERVNSEEKKHMNLEIEKMRRSEADWLQVAARLLDHTFLLNQAGQRSGQANLINQLNNFQNAQRDSVRRMGLVAFVPAVGEEFNPRAHQTETPETEPPPGSVISEILATGFTYQGQLLRRALVRVGQTQTDAPAESAPTQAEPVSQKEPTDADPSVETETLEMEPASSAENASHDFAEPMAAQLAGSVSPESPVPQEMESVSAEGSESVAEGDRETQPRRRARKSDPQTSLPF